MIMLFANYKTFLFTEHMNVHLKKILVTYTSQIQSVQFIKVSDVTEFETLKLSKISSYSIIPFNFRLS